MRFVRWLIVAAGAALLASCGNGDDGVALQMGDNWFEPEEAAVAVGQEIVFDNIGQVAHNALDVDGRWATELVDAGETATLTIDTPGTYRFYCSLHAPADASAGMVGTLTVVEDLDEQEASGRTTVDERIDSVEPVDPTGVVRSVPEDFPTIQSAVDAAEPGDLVLVEEGVYREQVDVATEQIVIRGVDRNEVVVDGEFSREMGFLVTADGVAIENITVRDVTTNGFYWTGVTGFRGSYLTASNAGTYGIYAFDSSDGVFEHSYASGSADAGYYVGQCHDCRTILNEVIAEHNALGFSGTNASNSLYLVNSTWRDNGAGIVPNTLRSQRYPPSRGAVIAGNLVESNDNLDVPVLSGTWPAFGNGILVAGGVTHEIRDNVVRDHPGGGVTIAPNLSGRLWQAGGNVVEDNHIDGSGRADLLVVAPSADGGDCFAGNTAGRTLPRLLTTFRGCDGGTLPSIGSYRQTLLFVGHLAQFPGPRLAGDMPQPPPHPEPQPQLPGGLDAPVRPAVDVFATYDGVDLAAIERPEVAAASVRERTLLIAGFPVSQMGAWQWYFAVAGWVVPMVALLALAVVALRDVLRRDQDRPLARWGWATAVGVPAAVLLLTSWPLAAALTLVTSLVALLRRGGSLGRRSRWVTVAACLGTLLVLTPALVGAGAAVSGVL